MSLWQKLNSFEEFKTFLVTTFNQFKPSLIALQEIWTKPQNLEFISENYHPLLFRIRDKQGLNNNSGELWDFGWKNFSILDQLRVSQSLFLGFLISIY